MILIDYLNIASIVISAAAILLVVFAEKIREKLGRGQ
tara:strand:- start:6155 stop:6265 length:111 start_codon:yes stop_codon:yes gene_type:complete